MKQRPSFPADLAPERYELDEAPAYHFAFDRREFMQVFGGGIVVLLALEEPLSAQESGGGRRRQGSPSSRPQQVGAWLHVDEDGMVTVYTGKVEVGQDIRTSLTQAVADELRVPFDSVRLVMGDTDLTPFDSGTFGSRSTPVMATQLRRASATARNLLIGLAAEAWSTDPDSLVVADGKVSHPQTGRTLGFGELTRGKELTETLSEGVATTPAERWTVAGRSIPKVDGRAFVTGAHRYPSDLQLENMWYGKVLRPTSFGVTMASVDTAKAEAMTDVVLVRDGDFVGVAAPSEAQAAAAVQAIQAEWQPSEPPQPSRAELFDHLKSHPRHAERGFGGPVREIEGSVSAGLAAADETIDAVYTVAYIAHVPLEPRAAVAQWTNGKLTVWTGTQRPFGVRSELAEAFRLSESQVRVLVPDTGSGYGGKHTGEAAIEAARLAKGAGRPVKLVWTREEEFTWAYFRPAGVIEVKSGVRNDGTITAWEFHNYNSGASGIHGLYDIANRHIEYHPTESPLRQGSYRGLAATANHFARETHIDELARSIGMDPVAFRLGNLSDERLRAVLQAAAERLGWAATESTGRRGLGIAVGFEKGGYVATGAEISVERPQGRITIERLVTAFECGAVVNPDDLRNQVEGSVIMGLGGALFEAVDFADGQIGNPRLAYYRVPRFSDVPVLETILVDRKDLPSAGAGETPIVCVAPAVGNAIFHATGVRLRSLPMIPNGVPDTSDA